MNATSLTENQIDAINAFLESFRKFYVAIGGQPLNVRFFAYNPSVPLEMLIEKIKEHYQE